MARDVAAQVRRMKRFDNPWRNPKLIWGAGILLAMTAAGSNGSVMMAQAPAWAAPAKTSASPRVSVPPCSS
ncbi:MAG: hypothetical protein ACPG7W_06900, partial [Paracoccaceae bacterium]